METDNIQGGNIQHTGREHTAKEHKTREQSTRELPSKPPGTSTSGPIAPTALQFQSSSYGGEHGVLNL